jgi:triphosphatase
MSSSPHFAQRDDPGHKDGREVEWQLAAADLGPVRGWLAGHPRIDGLVLEPIPTLQIFDTYFDTDDWRIFRAGYALRLRLEAGKSEATLKSLKSARTDMADRRELSDQLADSASGSIRLSGGPVGTRVNAVTGKHELQALFEVRTSRQRFAIRAELDSQPLGEIALDETTISRPGGPPRTSLQRVEVEAQTDSHAPLQALVHAMRTDCSLEPAADSKYSQGLKSAGLAPLPALRFEPTALDESMRIDAVGLANLRRYLSAWFVHEPAARLGDDPEALHDLRVAGRRLDAILRQFRPFLPAAILKIRPTLKKALRVLGEARDFDVALAELDEFTRQLPETGRASIEPLKRHLAAERTRARARMLTTLDSVSVQKDLAKLATALAQPSGQPHGEPANGLAPQELAVDAAPGLVRTRYKKVRKGADALGPDSSTEAYHAVRGRVKKLRYALESVSVIYGKPADEMIRALRRWQEKLGVQQDADVASRRLQALATAPPKGLPPETLFLMGRLAGHYAARAARARKRHARAYRKVRGRWKALRLKLAGSQLRTVRAAEPGHALNPGS